MFGIVNKIECTYIIIHTKKMNSSGVNNCSFSRKEKCWCKKVALVSGANTEVGQILLMKLVSIGMSVLAIDKEIGKIKNIAKQAAEFGGYIQPMRCDLNDVTDSKIVFKWIEEAIGPVSVLINVIDIQRPPFIPSENIMKIVLETYVVGITNCIFKTVALMEKHKIDKGHIITINGCRMSHCKSTTLDFCTKYATKLINVLCKAMKKDLALENIPLEITCISHDALADLVTKRTGKQTFEYDIPNEVLVKYAIAALTSVNKHFMRNLSILTNSHNSAKSQQESFEVAYDIRLKRKYEEKIQKKY